MNQDFEIVQSEYYSFEEYRAIVDKYSEIDIREINFQNRVVLALLDRVFINNKHISIEDVFTQYKNRESEYHTRAFYAWQHTPDLLIVKDWKYYNLEKSEDDYLAVVEIKSPVLHPSCELCFQRGIMVETEEVHHKKPLSEGGTHDRSNLIALCKSCHSRIHANRGDCWHNKTAAP